MSYLLNLSLHLHLDLYHLYLYLSHTYMSIFWGGEGLSKSGAKPPGRKYLLHILAGKLWISILQKRFLQINQKQQKWTTSSVCLSLTHTHTHHKWPIKGEKNRKYPTSLHVKTFKWEKHRGSVVTFARPAEEISDARTGRWAWGTGRLCAVGENGPYGRSEGCVPMDVQTKTRRGISQRSLLQKFVLPKS